MLIAISISEGEAPLTDHYRPQTKFAKVMFLQVSVILSTGGGHAWLLEGGMCGCSQGGMLGCSRGACMVALGGVRGCSGGCVVAPRGGMHGHSQGGMCGCSGGVHGCSQGGHVWLLLGGHAWDMMRYGDMINEQAVRILLECILVHTVCMVLFLPLLEVSG